MITQFMSDPAIFGKQFTNDSWDSWRALLSGFYSDGCTNETLTQRTPDGPYSELWMVIGRRGGRSNAATLIAVFEAFLKDHRDQLATGEVATVMVVANEKDHCIELKNSCVCDGGCK